MLEQYYRRAVLGVAGIPAIKNLLETKGFSLAKRFVAGNELHDAITAVETLEQDGVHGILDLLGEMISTKEQSDPFVQKILEIFPAIATRTFPKYISVKLSQLGLDVGKELALENGRSILSAAKSVGAFVRIDMEDSPRVDATLEVFRALREEFDNVGLVLQAMLRRTESDMASLQDLKPNLRIVKGAYLESSEVAYPEKAVVDHQYRRLVYSNLERGNYTAIATHDSKIIEDIKHFVNKSQIPHSLFEFQLLYGVRRDLQKSLAQEGYTVRAYIPYGKDWYAYFSRRIAERPSNALFVLRGIIGK
ncbi:MAG: proline dehydrogenase family protein [Deinococcales bacterium]